MPSALVTGGAGFIGSHLVRELLARGFSVACLIRKTTRLERLSGLPVTLAYGDVTDRESLKGPLSDVSIVFHLASCNQAVRSHDFYRVNEQGPRNLYEVAASLSLPPVVVQVSSLAAAGPSPRGRLRADGDPNCPVSHYGRSKRGGERAAEEYASRVPATIVRPCIVFGEGDRTGLDLFRAVALSRIHFVPGYLPNRFSLIHVADLVPWLILAAERGKRLAVPGITTTNSPPPGYYFAASTEHPTYYQFGQMIGRALGVRCLSMPWATAVVWPIATVNDLIGRWQGRPASLNLDKAREATAGSWACSPQSTIDDLGLAPTVPLQERLNQTVAWYRAEGWL